MLLLYKVYIKNPVYNAKFVSLYAGGYKSARLSLPSVLHRRRVEVWQLKLANVKGH